MKKVFSLIAGLALMLGVGTSLEAQSRDLRFTVGAGLALPKATGSANGMSVSVDLTETPYLYAGVDYALPSNSRVHLEGGLQWMLLGLKSASDNESYLSLPLSVRYQVAQDFPLSLGGGFYLGRVLVDDANMDYGLLLKARYDFTRRFFASLQYNMGLKNHSEIDEVSSKLKTLQIGVGFTF